MREPDDQITYMLEATANVTVTSAHGLGRDAAMPEGEFPLAEISESLDDQTCQLCRMLDGQIVRRDSPEYDEFRWPSHINCRRIMIYIGKDEIGLDGQPVQPAFVRPDDDIIAKHGHFHVDPNKYRELRIPSRPEGRDFIFSPGPKGEPGALLWTPGLSRDALRQTILDMADIGTSNPQLFRDWVASEGSGKFIVPDDALPADLKSMIRMHTQLEKLADDYPSGVSLDDPIILTCRDVSLRPQQRAFAGWDTNPRTIYAVQTEFADAQSAAAMIDDLQKAAGTINPVGCGSLEALATHEYGHAITGMLPKDVLEAWFTPGRAMDIGVAATQNPIEAAADAFAMIVHSPEPWPQSVVDMQSILQARGLI